MTPMARAFGLSGMGDGFWSDALDIGFDQVQAFLKPLAAQKLASEGIIHPAAPPIFPRPVLPMEFQSLPTSSPSAIVQQPGDQVADLAFAAVVLFAVLFLLGR
jgi:hypothetical protein